MGFTAIIDYGAGNLQSVTKALSYLGFNNEITDDRKKIEASDAVILPGVGAFPDAAFNLKSRGLDKVIKEQALKKPLLGICLGMQLLFEKSDEIKDTEGLCLIKGQVRKIKTALKLPHIGWNSLEFLNRSPIFHGVDEGAYVYFVHSFCGVAENSDELTAVSDYGEKVAAAVWSGNVFGCQFHPEKSGETGLIILKNFEELTK